MWRASRPGVCFPDTVEPKVCLYYTFGCDVMGMILA